MRRIILQLPRQAVKQPLALVNGPVLARAASRFSRARRPPAGPPHPRHHNPNSPVRPPDEPIDAHQELRREPHEATAAVTEAGPLVSRIPVSVPNDPDGVLDRAQGEWSEQTRTLLAQPAIVVARQLEPLNLFLGWEEANKYQLLSPEGNLLGYLLEEESSIAGRFSRQLLRNHRPFRATVLSTDGQVLLRIHRPFSWINSRIYVSTPSSASSTAQDAKNEMQRIEGSGDDGAGSTTALTERPVTTSATPLDEGEVIGETQQEWHLYRRRYNHFVQRDDEMVQFARTDSGFLSWDFFVRDESDKVIGSINRNFAGFGRELFTDTGQYVLRFEGVVDELNPRLEAPVAPGALPEPTTSSPASTSPLSRGMLREPESASTAVATREEQQVPPSLPLDQRAVLLATAITTDIDYFSRQRGGLLGGGGMFMPMPIRMGGGGGAAAEEAGEQGAVGTVGGAASDGPMPSTEYQEDDFARHARESAEMDRSRYGGDDDDAGRGGPSPGSASDQGLDSGRYDSGDGRGMGQFGAGEAPEEIMRDPWASEAPEEGGTWSWGDLFDQDGDGGGGGDGDGW